MISGGEKRSRERASLARPPMTNYYRGPADSSPSPFLSKSPKKSRFAFLAKALDIFIIVAVVFCFVYSLIVRPDPKVIVNSNQYHREVVYQSKAASDIDNFKDRSKLTFDQTALVAQLEKQFPEISSATVELPLFGQKPVVRLNIANPKFVLQSGGARYVIGDNGIAVAQTINFADDDSLPVVIDQSGFSAQVGKAVLSSSQVNFINILVEQCLKAKVTIDSLVLPTRAQELDLRAKDKNYYVKFYLGGDAYVEAGQFLAARHHFATSGKGPRTYLDVRVAGKIFYK